jgi:hypothetical protein
MKRFGNSPRDTFDGFGKVTIVVFLQAPIYDPHRTSNVTPGLSIGYV